MTVFHLIAAAVFLTLATPASADHIDPYEVMERALKALEANDTSAESRAVFSQALREAPHDGKLYQGFAIVYAAYSDLVRYDGDPTFALLLADRGLDLVAQSGDPDPGLRNILMTSRAYALADLGRYREAADVAAISAVWLGQRFGETAREDFEKEARIWAGKAESKDEGELPSALQIAIELLQQSDAAITRGDTAAGLALAPRAVLPEETGLDETLVRTVNATSQWLFGLSYSLEGRNSAAVSAFRAVIDLLCVEPWQGTGQPLFRPEFNAETARQLIWDTFIRLAQSALHLGAFELAAASLDVAQDYVGSPNDRYSLLIQRAALSMQTEDAETIEKVFLESETEARSVGDEGSALLARFYAAVIRLRAAYEASDGEKALGAGVDMLVAAQLASDAAGANTRQVEFILATAVWQATMSAIPATMIAPIAGKAFDLFRERQIAMAGYETGQDASRRERRRFLESYVDTLYEGQITDLR